MYTYVTTTDIVFFGKCFHGGSAFVLDSPFSLRLPGTFAREEQVVKLLSNAQVLWICLWICFVGMSMDDVALIDSRLKRPNLKSFLGVQRTVFGMMGITHFCIQYDKHNRIEDIDVPLYQFSKQIGQNSRSFHYSSLVRMYCVSLYLEVLHVRGKLTHWATVRWFVN